VEIINQATLTKFGFKFGKNGAHSARSMMIVELQQIFAALPADAGVEQYQSQIVDYNLLNKPTEKARKLTFRHLVDLYGMSPEVPLFRVMRRLWDVEGQAQPVLALQLALARDSLLRLTVPFMSELKLGESIVREQVETILKAPDPDRYSQASLKSFAQNINGTWTQAGFFKGKAKKVRSEPDVAPVNIAFALFLAYLEGASGQRLFSNHWCQLFGLSEHRLNELAIAAGHQGLIDYKKSGEVVEVRFHDYLTHDEESWLHE